MHFQPLRSITSTKGDEVTPAIILRQKILESCKIQRGREVAYTLGGWNVLSRSYLAFQERGCGHGEEGKQGGELGEVGIGLGVRKGSKVKSSKQTSSLAHVNHPQWC